MSIVHIILILALVGFLAYLLTTSPLPIHPWFKTLITGVLCFAVIVWMLSLAGIDTGIHLRLK